MRIWQELRVALPAFLFFHSRRFLTLRAIVMLSADLGFPVMSTSQARQSDRTLLSLCRPRFVWLHGLPFLGRNKTRQSVIKIYDTATATRDPMILNF